MFALHMSLSLVSLQDTTCNDRTFTLHTFKPVNTMLDIFTSISKLIHYQLPFITFLHLQRSMAWVQLQLIPTKGLLYKISYDLS